MADNIAYPGNPGLPREAREKILSTFRHSLNLFKAGKTEDCAVGCDFILKMDPRFVPAKRLLEKARDPNASVDLAELESFVAETLTPMEKLGAAAPDKLLISAIEAYADRDFDRAIESSNRVLSVLPGNSDAREILEKATRKKELQPHVENFRQRALFALESGQTDEAKRNFERMRSLDPEHPELERLAKRLHEPAAPAAAAEPAPPPEEMPAFDFPFSDFPETTPETSAPEPFGFAPAPPPPEAPLPPEAPAPPPPVAPAAPPPGEATGPLALDSLSLDVPPGEEWAPVPEHSAASPSGETAPAPDPSSFGDFWSTSTPEVSLEPAAPETPPAAAPAGASPEIQRLLDEGDRLAERGDHQGAIEVWSRVFLSDLSNPEAASRIENARTRIAETHRRVADALKQGRSLYESGKVKEAREKFLEVLAIDENESTARSYLHRIEEDLARPTASYDLSAAAPAGDVLAEEEEPRAEEPRRAPAPSRGAARPRIPLLPVAAALVVAIGIGLFLMFRPHPAAAPPPPSRPARAAAGPDRIAEATRLFQEGRVDEAREALARVPPEDPQYARAQKMLANFGPAAAPPPENAPAPATSAAPPPTAAAQRQEAEAALADHRYIAALTAFHQASAGYPGDADLKREMGEAAAKVEEISPAVKLFNDGDYDSALPILWRLYQADHQNADVKSYLVRCYYNQGVIALQNNLYDKAAKAFDDALGVNPDDALSKRQKAFAQRYVGKPADLLARVYLKYLRPRP
ncbi:MAG TPA: tetratricopeptide repeat protein [Thermoanaerobaculia bacterium]|nr:tetratricopeptide repeat protein [Thermoanaerobaculia bacterium]